VGPVTTASFPVCARISAAVQFAIYASSAFMLTMH
jgi:hypothetical protein